MAGIDSPRDSGLGLDSTQNRFYAVMVLRAIKFLVLIVTVSFLVSVLTSRSGILPIRDQRLCGRLFAS